MIDPVYEHRIRIAFGEHSTTGAGLDSEEIEEFEVESDMLELADPFRVTAACSAELWDLTPTDTTVRVFIDDTQVLEGFIDERDRALAKSGGSFLTLAGRDKGGRLADESAPLLRYGEAGDLQNLVAQLVAPWFPSVSLSNARNRSLVRGRGRRQAKVSGEPLIVDRFSERTGKSVGLVRKVEPGDTVASVLRFFLERAGLLGWSSADGREFIVGQPNYQQAPQFFFFAAGPESSRAAETNVETVAYRESVSERYSEIRVVGSSRGDTANYGPSVTRRTATVQGPGFLHRKRLIVADHDVRSAADAKMRAEIEMAVRSVTAQALELDVAGYGQVLGSDTSARPALYACDTVARWEDEEIGVKGDYLITQVKFKRSKLGGEKTHLKLVPVGTPLVTA